MDNRRESKPCLPPLGLAYIAGYLRSKGHMVQIYDMQAEHYHDEISLRNGYITYGWNPAELICRLSIFRPDYVGISCITSQRHWEMIDVLKTIKNVYPKIITVVGGNHPSSLPELVMKEGNPDYCVIGEGELAFQYIIESNPPKGIIDFSKVHPEIDDLSFPAHDLLPLDKYLQIWNETHYHFYQAQKFVIMNTSRGCAHGCEHCPHEVVFGKRWRNRSLELIEEELKFVISLGVKEVQFHEYNGFMDKEYMYNVALLMKKYNLVWNVPIGVWIKQLDKEFIKHLKDCGMNCIDLAIESPKQNVLCTMPGKNVDIEHALEVIDWCKDVNLYVNAFFMIGFPDQTLKEMWDTVIWARTLDLDSYAIFIAQPLPKTKLWDKAKFIDGFHPFMLRYGKCNTLSELWTPQQVENIRYQGRIMFDDSKEKNTWGIHRKVI
jgi:magnesium-protoporphyrin IX monomethyl ester (oxidative) cyclase